MIVVHLLDEETAGRWPVTGEFLPDSLAKEGFVHLCLPEQVDGVRARFFAGRSAIAIVLDAARFGSPLRFEDSYGHGSFPHLYGAIPVAAEQRRVVLKPGERWSDQER